MKGFIFSAAIAAALMGFGNVNAATMNPQDALKAALEMTQTSSSSKMKAQSKGYELAYTLTDSATNTPTIYVFAQTTEGFIIASADDAVTPLLGFSSASTFDPNNIPPVMLEWLGMLSDQIASYEVTAASINSTVESSRKGASSRVGRSDIEPLVSSHWNQSAPFNDQCPLMGSSRGVTGCVATAIAQIMNYHQWPAKGTGSNSYSWKYGSTTYKDSMNFGSVTFDWSNMLDDYVAGSYTSTEAAAVAQLMHAVGVASNMEYSPSSSGANTSSAVAAMSNYFDYDKGVQMHKRKWYTENEWSSLLYNELKSGRPILFSGRSNGGGHAFVCDGYDAYSGYFHFNWGWGGISDGYFTVADLNPYSQGIGGSSSADGFNQNVIAFLGIQKNIGTEEIAPMLSLDAKITTDRTKYNRASGEKMKLSFNIASACLKTYDLVVGFKLVSSSTGEVDYLPLFYGSLKPGYYWTSYTVTSNEFPIGEYDAYPVFMTFDDFENGSAEWTPIVCDVTIPNHLHLLTSASQIVVQDVAAPDVFEATVTSITPMSRMDYNAYHPGHTYVISFALSSSSAWSNEVAMFINNDPVNPVWTSTDQASKVDITAGDTQVISYTYTIPYSQGNRPVEVELCTVDANGNIAQRLASYTLEPEYDEDEGYATFFSYESLYNVQPILGANEFSNPYVLDVNFGGIRCYFDCIVGPWIDNMISGHIFAATADNAKAELVATTNVVEAEFNTGIDYVDFFIGTLAEGLDNYSRQNRAMRKVLAGSDELKNGQLYAFFPYHNSYGYMTETPFYFTMQDGHLTSVETIEEAASNNAQYFNLNGQMVSNPEAGVYLRRDGSKTTKVYIR